MRSIVTSTVTGECIVYQWVVDMGEDDDGNDGIYGLILGRGTSPWDSRTVHTLYRNLVYSQRVSVKSQRCMGPLAY